jgi:hypothetical protein
MSTPAGAGAAVLVRQYFTDGYYPTGGLNLKEGFQEGVSHAWPTCKASMWSHQQVLCYKDGVYSTSQTQHCGKTLLCRALVETGQ